MLWVIRHIPTGHFLPRPMGKCGRGGSWVEPEPCHNKPVRALSKRGANSALARWLEGRWVQPDYEDCGYPKHDPNRIKSDMEIVPVEMMENNTGFSPVYVIRDKTTGMYYNPEPVIADNEYKPESWREFTETNVEETVMFKSHLAARRVLVPWLRGKTESFSTFKNPFEYHDKLIPGTRRHEVDYEIVLFTFKVI